MGKLLDNLQTGLSLASGGVGLLSGIKGLFGGNSDAKKQAEYQQKLQLQLMEKQQEYAKSNALLDYQRQRQLVLDNASLSKQGMRNAGLSTAGDFNGSAPSVSPISSPSAPSAPSMQDPTSRLMQSIGLIQSSTQQMLNTREQLAKTKAQELDNYITENSLQDKVSGAKGEGRASYAKGQKELATVKPTVDAAKAGASKSQSDAATAASQAHIAAVNDKYNEAEHQVNLANSFQNLLNAKQMLANAKQLYDKGSIELKYFEQFYQAQLADVQASAKLKGAQTVDTMAHVGVNIADAENKRHDTLLKDAQTYDTTQSGYLKGQEHYFNETTFDARKRILENQSLPQDLKQALLQSDAFQKFAMHIRKGEKVPPALVARLTKVLIAYGALNAGDEALDAVGLAAKLGLI